jgi:peptidyl-prolyl cis-trans isomerase C
MAGQRLRISLVAFPLMPLVLAGCASGALSPPTETTTTSRLQKADNPATLPPAADPHPTDKARAPEGECAACVRAKVNGVAILDEELKNAIFPLMVEIRNRPEPERSELEKKIIQQALDKLIEREAILAIAFGRLKHNPQGQKVLEKLHKTAAKQFDKKVSELMKKSGSKTEEDFRKLLKEQGQSLDGMRRQFERTLMATEYMRYLVLTATEHIGLADAKEYYDQHPDEFQTTDSVKWQDIFIASVSHGGPEGARRFAAGLLARARRGANFAKLVEQYDEGDSRFRHGLGYGQRRGDIKPPEVEPYLFRMADRQLGPLVELSTGVHLIRVVKREYAGRMPFDAKTQNFIINKLKNEAANREWKRLVKKFRSEAIIEAVDDGP